MVYDADIPNLRQELDWLIHVRTCEWCGRTMAAPIPKEWRCLEDKEKRTKHWRNWRVCLSCGSSPFSVGFVYAPYIPLLVSSVINLPDLREIMAVQPMAAPDSTVFYMDYVYKKPTAADQRRARNAERGFPADW